MKSQIKYILAVCTGSLFLCFVALRGKLAEDQVGTSQDVSLEMLHSGLVHVDYTPIHVQTRELHDEPDDLEIHGAHRERSQHVKKICKKKSITRHKNGIIPETFNQLLVDDKHRFLYCEVPKVACTNWKRVMLILTGRMNTSDPSAIPPAEAHGQMANKLLRKLNTYSPQEIQYRLKHYYKFMFVRNPLERLLSAYRNKFTMSYNTYFPDRFGRKIIRQYRHKPSAESLRRGHDVKFHEFVQYLVDPKTTEAGPLNAHWRHYYKLCQPCQIPYDFIGKYESLQDDVEHVLSHLHVQDVVTFPSYPPRKGPSTSAMLQQAYANVSSHNIHKLWEMYSVDFALFSYEYPDFPARH